MLKLSGVPTLLKYGERAKLVEDQLFKDRTHKYACMIDND